MKKLIKISSLLIIISYLSCRSQIIPDNQFTNIISELKEIPRDTSLNNIKSNSKIDFKFYSELISNYDNPDSVYSINSKGIHYKGTWSGYIDNDISVINVDNTDENGKIIEGKPDQISYKNEITILGSVNLNDNFLIIPIKVETYDYFVIHLFSFNNKGKLLSVIPAGKVEKNKESEFLTVQNAFIDNINNINATYLSEAFVTMKYELVNGHFKVIYRKIEE